ncbi:MAG: multidrug transporter EmrE-like cation transporter [Polyangiales bacterium]
MQLVFVGTVETIKRAVGLVSAVVLGRFLFAESITPRLVLGIAGLTVGTVLLVLG